MWRSWIAGCLAVAGWSAVHLRVLDRTVIARPSPLCSAGGGEHRADAVVRALRRRRDTSRRCIRRGAASASLRPRHTRWCCSTSTRSIRRMRARSSSACSISPSRSSTQGSWSAATRSHARRRCSRSRSGLYCTVGLPTTGLTLPGDPGNGGTVNKVDLPEQQHAERGDAATEMPACRFRRTRSRDPPSSSRSARCLTVPPLNTKLDQYGPFYDVKVSPEIALTAEPHRRALPRATTTARCSSRTTFRRHVDPDQVLPPGGSIWRALHGCRRR